MASTELRHRLLLALKEEKYRNELLSLLHGSLTGDTYYVDSGSGKSAALGTASDSPLATLAQALAKCTANNGDVIFLMPGHNEGIGNAQIDINVAGVTIIGLGHGSSRPRFDFDHANASINVQSSNCVVKNITLLPSVTDVLIGIDVEAAVTDTLLENIEALPGEEGDGTDDFALVVDIKAGCTRTTVRGLKVRQHASAVGYLAGVRLTGASDDCLIEDCDIWITGTGVVAPINGLTTASTKLTIRNCRLTSDAEPGVELVTASTGVIENCLIFSDLATIDAATVADGLAHWDVKYVEVGNEAGTLVKTESADD